MALKIGIICTLLSSAAYALGSETLPISTDVCHISTLYNP